jgi:hypothetical protein
MPDNIKFEIIETYGVLSETDKGWKKELNLVSWNDNAPKYDLRDWSENHERMGKGITLNNYEFDKLKDILKNM